MNGIKQTIFGTFEAEKYNLDILATQKNKLEAKFPYTARKVYTSTAAIRSDIVVQINRSQTQETKSN